MKQLLLILAIAGMALSSCTGKYTIAKRKYTKGFYVSRSAGNKTTTHEIADVKKSNTSEIVSTEIVTNTKTADLAPALKEVSHDQNKSTMEQTLPNKTVHFNNAISKSLYASSNSEVVKQQITFKKLEISANSSKQSSKKSSDTDLIIQVILALFPILCLIAVYLHDGKSITLNFWIDLLLHLTVIGEIIFALLVVLDVVNLA